MLTDDEKNRLRAEIAYRVAISRELETPKSKLATFLSHPATITVLGGILISFASMRFQYLSSVSQQELQCQQQMREKQILFITSFLEKFENDFQLLYNFCLKRAEIYELERRSSLDNNKKTQNDSLKNQEMRTDITKNYKMIAPLMTVQAFFRSHAVIKSTEFLEHDIAYLSSHEKMSKKDVERAGDNVYRSVSKLVEKMGNEIDELSPSRRCIHPFSE